MKFLVERIEVMFLAAYTQSMVFKLQLTTETSYYGNAQ